MSYAHKRIIQEFARLMGVNLYSQLARLLKAALIKKASLFLVICPHGITEILTLGSMRLSMIRAGISGYILSYSARLSMGVHD